MAFGTGVPNIDDEPLTNDDFDNTKTHEEAFQDIIDLRPESEFIEAHYPNSTNFPGLEVPDGLFARSHELPPPHLRNKIAVVAEDDVSFKKARAFLLQKCFKDVRWLQMERIRLESGTVSRKMWKASGLLEDCISQIESELGGTGTALDLGCGSGRDSAFLAGRGWSVCALDRDESLLENARELGKRYSRSNGWVDVVQMTLGTDVARDRRLLEERQADLLVVIRFLRKSVLPLLPGAVKRGGFVVYEHFLTGCEKFGSPRKPSYMVERDELANLFQKSSFTIVRDEVSTLPDGRPVIHFIAKKSND